MAAGTACWPNSQCWWQAAVAASSKGCADVCCRMLASGAHISTGCVHLAHQGQCCTSYQWHCADAGFSEVHDLKIYCCSASAAASWLHARYCCRCCSCGCTKARQLTPLTTSACWRPCPDPGGRSLQHGNMKTSVRSISSDHGLTAPTGIA